MSAANNRPWKNSVPYKVHPMKDFEQIADDLCQPALKEARSQLHPLLQETELNRLDQRAEFLQAFKSALEEQCARKLATWFPSILTIFSYDVTLMKNPEDWDGSIHLLAKVPRFLKAVKALDRQLDGGLLYCLNRLNWQRFQECQSILEVQQVTQDELRHGIGYGAMFYAAHTLPIKVWPLDSRPE